MPLFGTFFLNLGKATAQTAVSAQLMVIKANNSKEFYDKLLKTGADFFDLLHEGTKNKTVSQIAEIFEVPLEQAAAENS